MAFHFLSAARRAPNNSVRDLAFCGGLGLDLHHFLASWTMSAPVSLQEEKKGGGRALLIYTERCRADSTVSRSLFDGFTVSLFTFRLLWRWLVRPTSPGLASSLPGWSRSSTTGPRGAGLRWSARWTRCTTRGRNAGMDPPTHPPGHPATHSFAHRPIHPPTHQLTHPPTYQLTHQHPDPPTPPTHPLTHPPTYPPTL